MFKKLRNKFLTLNMIMIFHITCQRVLRCFYDDLQQHQHCRKHTIGQRYSNIQPKGQRFFNPFQSDPNMNRKEIFPHIPNNEGPAPDEPSSLNWT